MPAIISLAVISATTVKLATNLPAEREAGQLKRVRGTPLPPAAFVAGRVGNSLVISVIMVALVSVIGDLLYGVTIPTHTMPAMLVTLAVGAFSVLLPRLRARRRDPDRGGRAGRNQRDGAAALLPVRRLHSPG